MKLQNDGEKNFFLATPHYSDTCASFLISQGSEYTTLSSFLTSKNAKMLRDEIDNWLRSEESEEPNVDLFSDMNLDRTYSDQLNEAIDKKFKESRNEK